MKEVLTPATLMPAQQFRGFLSECMWLTGDSLLGLRAGQQVAPEDLRLLRLPAFGVSCEVPQEVEPIFHGAQVTCRQVTPDQQPPGRVWSDYFAARWLSLARATVGQDATLDEVRLTGPCPKDTVAYEPLFQCQVRFDAEHVEVVLARPTFDAIQQCGLDLGVARPQGPMQVVEPKGSVGSIPARVREMARDSLPDALPDLHELARKLDIHARSLRRKLSREGANYRRIVDDVRRELALLYLAEGLSPNDVCDLLGYAESPVLYRAFRRWTGASLSHYLTQRDREQ